MFSINTPGSMVRF